MMPQKCRTKHNLADQNAKNACHPWFHQLSTSNFQFIQIEKMWLLLYARPPPTRLLLYLDNNWFNDYRCFLHTADVKLGAVPVNHFFCYFYLTDIAAKWLVLFAYLWKEICVWPKFDPFLVPLLLPYLLLWVCFWKVRNSTGFNIFMARTFEIWAWVTMFKNHQKYLVKLLGQNILQRIWDKNLNTSPFRLNQNQ